MSDLILQLVEPIKYDFQGEKIDGTFVSIFPPKTKHIHLTSVLKQAFQISAMKISEESGGDDDKEDSSEESIKPSDAIALIYAGGKSVNIKEVMLTAKELMTSGLVLVEGESKLTKPLCELLCQEDFENILGMFLVNFIVASLLTTQKKK